MSTTQNFAAVQKKLQASLKPAFTDVAVEVGENIHYKGRNIVITSPDFAGLLPEQRFHHVARALPADVYEELRNGFVWFELAPKEPAMNYMKMPRSEDIASQDEALHKQIKAMKFFKKFETKLRKAGGPPSKLDFVVARQVLADEGLSAEEVTRFCLFFILHGGHSDLQVYSNVMEELSSGGAEDESDAKTAAKKKPGAKAPG